MYFVFAKYQALPSESNLNKSTKLRFQRFIPVVSGYLFIPTNAHRKPMANEKNFGFICLMEKETHGLWGFDVENVDNHFFKFIVDVSGNR